MIPLPGPLKRYAPWILAAALVTFALVMYDCAWQVPPVNEENAARFMIRDVLRKLLRAF